MRRPTPRPARGAARRQRGILARMRGGLSAWLTAHGRALLGSLGRLARMPLSALMTVGVLAISLALPALFLLMLQNVERLSADWDRGASLSVFLGLEVESSRVQELADEFAQRPPVQASTIIPPEQALEDFRRMAGMDEALDLLDENPLPAVIVLVPDPGLDAEALQVLGSEIEAEAEVDTVRLDLAWVERLQRISELLRRAVWLVAGLLGLTVVLVVGNTIRLAIQNRREEIVIAKLIGATDGFIRRPFLYEGLWYGLLGGLTAAALVGGVRLALAGPASELARLYQTGPILVGPGATGFGLLCLAGIALGLTGSWLAVGRHLAAIEPK
ncbi:permease-like cell division protein FtsX [Methylonatrum kenyense]|uniref:permease-like cell division protein FtsX n=1 Tax=Methylonatrum kenyense TaxID=455253 RepID=UPI0020BF6D39|nr:permease-like cell division protein FtsX [Methylonatrum kenyense]MCK8515497.1 permease-like cell division protein FtsX [Methylonatrum kenyense]